tara:strand:+ start:13168 stop:13761 length:594 start_codon:yes stop_codon:yes gene_type:complete
MNKPFSPACERNQKVILDVLQNEFKNSQHILEVGSGTGQHAVYFAEHLSHLVWHTSDREMNHAGINLWLDEAKLKNIARPITLDVNKDNIKHNMFDAMFTANTFHIMSWSEVCFCIQKVGDALLEQGLFLIYGPFNFEGQFTSVSNQNFDVNLKLSDPEMGIRNFEDIQAQCEAVNLVYQKKYLMPANNMILVFKKI